MKMKSIVALMLASVMVATSPMSVMAEEAVSAKEVSQGQVSENMVSALDGMTGLQAKYHVDFEITSAMMAKKVQLAGTLDKLSRCIPGEDFTDNQIVVSADSKEKAEEIAAGFDGEVIAYQDEIATIETKLSTVEAVTMAADEDMQLPAVYPNYIYTVDGTFFESMKKEQGNIKHAETDPCADIQREEKADPAPVLDEETVSADAADTAVTEENTGNGRTDANDPDLAKQWYHTNVDTFNAWKVTKGAGVTVAVLDSGINTGHIEFRGRVNAVSKVTGSLAANGAEDNFGHGTHVSGIIGAAANNGNGGAGIAPEVSILSVKVLDNGGNTAVAPTGSTADICAGINYAAEQGVRVINMSIGGPSDAEDVLYEEAVNNALDKGAAVVTSAGNDTSDNSKVKTMPACINGVIAVSSTTPSNELSWYSNYGRIDVAAPGGALNGNDAESIWSTSIAANGAYEYMCGTSMASPVAAGVAALVVAKENPSRDRTGANAVADKLKSTAVNLGNKSSFGAGLVNAAAAVGAVSIYTKDGNYSVASKKTLQLCVKSDSKVTWSVDASAPATINAKSGKLKAGVVTVKTVVPVTATLNGVSDTVDVTIYPAAGKITSNSQKNITVKFREKATFSVTCNTPYTFKSSNNRIATINKNGLILGMANGTATMTATAVGGKKVTMKVKVTDTPYQITKIVPATSKLEAMGTAFRSTYMAQMLDIENQYCAVVSAGKSMKLKAVSEWPYSTSSNKKLVWNCSGTKNYWSWTNGEALSVKNGTVKIAGNITEPVWGTVVAYPEKLTTNMCGTNIIGAKPVKNFHFGSSILGKIYKVKTSTSATVTKGSSTNVDYSFAVANASSRAYNPYPYVVSTDESIAIAEYDDSRAKCSIKITGNKAGTCKVYLYSMDGAYKKGVINVTVK